MTAGTHLDTLMDARMILALVVLAGVTCATCASPARADASAELAKFAGSYQFVGTDEEGMAVIDKAIEEAVSQMNKVKALVIRKVLEANKRLIKQVKIDFPSGRVHMKLDDLEADTKLGESKDIGSGAKLTVRVKDGKLEQIIESDRGAFTTVYQLVQGGAVLQRDVTVTDKWLDKPVRYRLLYKRR